MTTGLEGRCVLVVEDESLVAMLLEAMLEDMGCIVIGPAGTIEEALDLIAAASALDAALLDVNVAGRVVFPIATALVERDIPFMFSTGFGAENLPDEWRGRPAIQKPFTETAVRAALQSTLGISLA
jgi:CheY-like chemotaxis protein